MPSGGRNAPAVRSPQPAMAGRPAPRKDVSTYATP